MMRKFFCKKLAVLGIAGSVVFSSCISPAHARRAYDSSGSASQSSSSNQNPYAINQYSTPSTTSTTTSTSTSSSSQSAAPAATQYRPSQTQSTSPQNQFTSPRTQFSPPRNQYTPPQNQYAPQPRIGIGSYPQQTRSNGTNFYGISPEQISGSAVREDTYAGAGGAGRGGYDARWNPNFGTGFGAQTMARESNNATQSLRDNFPLPMNGDEAQMFQVNDFAARSNGGMQGRPRN